MSDEVIILDDDEYLRNACVQTLELAGFSVSFHPSARKVLDILSANWPGVLVTDVKMPGEDGIELMNEALAIDSDLPVILMTGHGDIQMAVDAMRRGAYDFIEKPFASKRLVESVKRALEKRRLVIENRFLGRALQNGSKLERSLIGRSPAIVRLREQIQSFAKTDADILILGETGSGKEVVARGLHNESSRKSGRFVPINCGALPNNVIESELFGHEAGAFTGAQKSRMGKFEYAIGGTLFLDEIESMPLELQTKFLRVLQDRCIVRLGSNTEMPVDVRVLAATKVDLQTAVAKGLFREDLYFRLNVLSMHIPPLRNRSDDIYLLFNNFLKIYAEQNSIDMLKLSATEIASLMAHDWPGNVRELQNAALRYTLGLGLQLGNMSANISSGNGCTRSSSLGHRIAEFEKYLIQETLAENKKSLKATYQALGISRKSLYDKMKKYGLSRMNDTVLN